MAVLINVDARRRADGLLRSFLQRRGERLLGPLLFGLGRLTAVLEQIGDRRFSYTFSVGLGLSDMSYPTEMTEENP